MREPPQGRLRAAEVFHGMNKTLVNATCTKILLMQFFNLLPHFCPGLSLTPHRWSVYFPATRQPWSGAKHSTRGQLLLVLSVTNVTDHTYFFGIYVQSVQSRRSNAEKNNTTTSGAVKITESTAGQTFSTHTIRKDCSQTWHSRMNAHMCIPLPCFP